VTEAAAGALKRYTIYHIVLDAYSSVEAIRKAAAAVMTGMLQIVASRKTAGVRKQDAKSMRTSPIRIYMAPQDECRMLASDAGPKIYCLGVATSVCARLLQSGNIFMSPTRKCCCCCCNIAIADHRLVVRVGVGVIPGVRVWSWPKGFGTGWLLGCPACGKCEYSGDRLINSKSNSHRSRGPGQLQGQGPLTGPTLGKIIITISPIFSN